MQTRIKPKSWNKLDSALKQVYKENSPKLNPVDTQALIIVCDSTEAPNPGQLLGIIESIKEKKYHWTVRLFHEDQNTLKKWYEDNPDVPRTNIKVMAELRKTLEWQDAYNLYIKYREHPNNKKRVEDAFNKDVIEYVERKRKQALEKNNIEYTKDDIELLREEAREHYLHETVDFLYEAEEWRKKAVSVAPRITAFLYKNPLNSSWSDSVYHSNLILGRTEKELLLRWVKHELAQVPPVKQSTSSVQVTVPNHTSYTANLPLPSFSNLPSSSPPINIHVPPKTSEKSGSSSASSSPESYSPERGEGRLRMKKAHRGEVVNHVLKGIGDDPNKMTEFFIMMLQMNSTNNTNSIQQEPEIEIENLNSNSKRPHVSNQGSPSKGSRKRLKNSNQLDEVECSENSSNLPKNNNHYGDMQVDVQSNNCNNTTNQPTSTVRVKRQILQELNDVKDVGLEIPFFNENFNEKVVNEKVNLDRWNNATVKLSQLNITTEIRRDSLNSLKDSSEVSMEVPKMNEWATSSNASISKYGLLSEKKKFSEKMPHHPDKNEKKSLKNSW